MKLRTATRRDAAGIAALHTASWRSAYRGLVPERRLGAGLENDRRWRWRVLLATMTARDVVLVADEGEQLVGFIAIWTDRSAPALIDNLHVAPELRGKGIGELLLRAAARGLRARKIKRTFLWAFVANGPALRFYKRLGGLADRRSFREFPPATPPCQRVVWRRLDQLCC